MNKRGRISFKSLSIKPMSELQRIQLFVEAEIRNRRVKNVLRKAAGIRDKDSSLKEGLKDLEVHLASKVRTEEDIENALDNLEHLLMIDYDHEGGSDNS